VLAINLSVGSRMKLHEAYDEQSRRVGLLHSS
jgi:hypothetical protein